MILGPRDLYRRVLGTLGEGPAPLDAILRVLSRTFELRPPVGADDLLRHCREEGPDDPITLALYSRLAEWDYKPNPRWNQDTAPSTKKRRSLVYKLMELKALQRQACDELFPYAPAMDQVHAIVDPKGWKRWYTPERQAARHFYWDAYERQLTLVRKWEGQNLAAMRQSTLDVVERFADPEGQRAVPTKGLVIGYVQSGKTANFTGVIARAADAGYRLFVVLAGTQNTLRDQTQRRIDKELIGKELLGDEYEDADDYDEFVNHGGRPSYQGSFDWERLTYATEDFTHLHAGLAALRFKRAHLNLPFRHPSNLHAESARLIVVKKNPKSLRHLLKSLEAAATHVQWSEVPSVVIDDESDQASLNTRPPGSEVKARTTINRLIVELLKLLKAPQYVGYTATPFANVFTNPDDAEDLFPADYIVPLPRPAGYMGVRDFYDDVSSRPNDYSLNENAFVRSVVGDDQADGNLAEAIDAFVLSGALKLYRGKKDKRHYKHHTMLVHQSTRIDDQETQATLIRRLFVAANYCGSARGLKRLSRLWDDDFHPVSRVQGKGFSIPRSFGELVPYIGECYAQIVEGESPILILNGDYSEDAPDFDRTSVWKIIVGGAKLSRGYTVEGLTVSYYRRRAQAADTLMQMGRWFGYRKGYRDLVRLYIGRNEPLPKTGTSTIDLYEAFRATCYDEEEFRGQLQRYASLEEAERITPKQVPPLVPSHMLPPTARNKMYNAKVSFTNFGEQEVQRTVVPQPGKAREKDLSLKNLALMNTLLKGGDVQRGELAAVVGTKAASFAALWCQLGSGPVLEFLRNYKWGPGHEGTLQLVGEFLGGKSGDPGVANWLMIAPQSESDRKGTHSFGGVSFNIRERSRSADKTRYLVYSEPDHIRMARFLAQLESGESTNRLTARLRKPKQAVLLFYPVRSKEEGAANLNPTVGFVLTFPKNHIKKRVAFSVRDEAHPDAVVVDV